jgi:hypothetical protein
MDTAARGWDEQLGVVLARLHLMSEPTIEPPHPSRLNQNVRAPLTRAGIADIIATVRT